ncbi:MAG TPA: PspC domain-containing protein [Acidimicrobiales bacterium]
MPDETATAEADAPPPPPPAPIPRRRLTRSATNHKAGGVAAGVATYLDIDPTLVRAGFVVAGLLAGTATVIAYLLAWVLLPEEGADETLIEAKVRERGLLPTMAIGVGALLLTLIVMSNTPFRWWSPLGGAGSDLLGPLILVAAGVFLYFRDPAGHEGRAEAPTDPIAPSSPIPSPLPASPAPVPPRRRPRPSPLLRNATLGSALLAGAITASLGLIGAVSVPTAVVLAVMLAVVAAGTLASAWWGRRRGLLGFAIVLALALGVASVPGLTFAGGIGSHTSQPTARREVHRTYRLGIGAEDIDLGAVPFPAGRTTKVTAHLGVGRLRIWVPADVDLHLSGHISAGDLRLNDRPTDISGANVSLQRHLAPITTNTDAGRPPVLNLHIETGAGAVEVYQDA